MSNERHSTLCKDRKLIFIKQCEFDTALRGARLRRDLRAGKGAWRRMALGLERKQLVMVVVLLSGTFVAVLNATLLTPALPTIMKDRGVASTTVQWLTSGYALVEAVVIPLSAYLMGRFPERRLYIVGISMFAVGSLVAALAPSFPFLLAGRMIQAACTGAVLPMVMSVVLLVFPREKRGSAMGIVGLLIGFAPAIGPSLSGVLIDTVGWRWIFGIVAIIAAVIVASAVAVLKSTTEFRRTRFDGLSVVPPSAFSACSTVCPRSAPLPTMRSLSCSSRWAWSSSAHTRTASFIWTSRCFASRSSKRATTARS